ncbi:MAG: hypothetical protein ABH967_02450 [Patescibacteria group bacterium]
MEKLGGRTLIIHSEIDQMKPNDEIDLKRLLELGFRETGTTRRGRTTFMVSHNGKKMGLIVSLDNKIFVAPTEFWSITK